MQFILRRSTLKNPFKRFTKFEWCLYIFSLIAIIICAITAKNLDPVSAAALLVGATGLILCAKGEPLGQILIVIFALLYGYISLTFRYYGEMITYLGLSAPAAIASLVAWIRNPYEKGNSEVKVENLSVGKIIFLWVATAIITIVFYFVLKFFDTPNLIFSTLSVSTSFLASLLTYLRSPYYAVGYAANDIVLIVLWVLASVKDTSYIPMVVCFCVFLLNDSYGFINWQRMKKRQRS